jgi:hypothetical protein
VLQVVDIVGGKDVKDLSNTATVLVQNPIIGVNRLPILVHVDGVPDWADKVLEPVSRDAHAGDKVLAVEVCGDHGTDLGEVKWVLGFPDHGGVKRVLGFLDHGEVKRVLGFPDPIDSHDSGAIVRIGLRKRILGRSKVKG